MSGTRTRVLSALVMVPALVATIYFAPPIVLRAVILVVAVIGIMEMTRMIANAALRVVAAVLWILIPLLLLAEIRDNQGPQMVVFIGALLILSDTAQYFVGRALGRHKLAPSISPSKTVEGAVGGLVVVLAASPLLARAFGLSLPMTWIVPAGVTAIAGMIGDLFESYLKRRVGLKDSGTLIPGHGGVLDRIDSWLFAIPVFALMEYLWAAEIIR